MDGHRFGFEFEWTINANWKVFLDNAIECYHCSTCHPALARVLEMNHRVQHLSLGGRFWSSHTIPFRRVPLGERAPIRHPTPTSGRVVSEVNTRIGTPAPPGASAAASDIEPRLYHFHWIFPATYFQHAGWGFDIGSVDVLGVEEIRFRSLTFVPTDTPADELEALRQRYSLNPTVDEDVAICGHVQRAHATGMAAPGRLLPSSEWLLGHFQRVVVEMVAGVA